MEPTTNLNWSDLSIPLVVSFENTLNNNENSLFFKNTLDNNQWDYTFIGEGLTWEGFKTKIINYYNFLNTLPEDKIVILSDSRDVICTRNPRSFMDCIVYNNIDLNNQIIVSAEMFLRGHMDWTDDEITKVTQTDPDYFWQGIKLTKYWEYYNVSPLPVRKYINSGLIIGKVRNLKHTFNWIIENKYKDDQLGLSWYTHTFPEKVYLDYKAIILHTSTFGVCGGFYSTKQNVDSPTFAELLGMSSFFLHIPGLSGSKGQHHIYTTVKKIVDLKLCNQQSIVDLYGIQLNHNFEYEYINKNK